MSVPYVTVSTYTARQTLSEQLSQKLHKPYRGKALAYAVAVTGLGGTGKTQLVLHYVEEHEDEYSTILWIDARSEETARSSFVRCCRALGLPCDAGTGEGKLQDAPAVQAVLLWLRSQEAEQKWLVIVDNADDLSWDVSSIIPQGRAGSVIVTSQDSQASRLLGGKSDAVKVDVMETEEAVSLLLSNVDGGSAEVSDETATLVTGVVDLLDKLPLAIELAGARIKVEVDDGEDTVVAMRRYVADFRRHQNKLLGSNDFVHTSSNKKTVWTAWEASLAALRNLETSQADIRPAQLLAFLSQLDRANIQYELFRLASLGLETASRQLDTILPLWLQKVLSVGTDGEWDDIYYRESVKSLQRYGLVRPVRERWGGVTMHSLVRWRASQEGDADTCWQWYVAFLTAACSQLLDESETVQFRRHIIVHLPSNSRLLEKGVDAWEGGLWTSTIIGQIWKDEGRWKESEVLFFTALQKRKEVVGEKHPSTLMSMANLASTYWRQGRWDEAEQLEARVLELRKEALGEKHPDTLTSMGNLALTYRDQGRWDEAEQLGVRVLEFRKEALGEMHPDTLTSMGNLALTYRDQGRWDEAEQLKVRVLEFRKEALGEKHPDTLTSMSNLASTYRDQGRWDEAEQLKVRVLELRKEALGEKHPSTLTSMSNLASTYQDQGRWDEAEQLEVRVLELRKEVLGEKHPDTLTSMGNLALTYRDQGRWDEAEQLGVRVLEFRKEALGEMHPDTLTSMGVDLALTYRDQGRWDEAEQLKVRVLEFRKEALGEKHPDTLTSMSNLASTYRDQGRWDEAEQLKVRVLELRKEALGEKHPDTLISMADLASTYWRQGRWDEAEQLEAQVLELRKEALGEKHPDTLMSMADLASTYWRQGRWDEAEQLKVRVLEMRKEVLGEKHPDILTALDNLAMTYRSQGRAEKANSLYSDTERSH